MSTTPALRGRRGVAFWLVAAACLLASHDLIYLVQLGPGRGLADALRTAGHGYWPMLSSVIALSAIGLLARTGLRLHRLGRRARELPSRRRAPARIGPFVRIWTRLLLVVAVAFLVQENVEHFVSHAHVPLLGALGGPEYPLALPLLALITLLGTIGTVVVRERERTLLARIASGSPHPSRSRGPQPRRPSGPMRLRRIPILARPDLSRAPPPLHA
jgi:hypothetical protein